MVTLPPRRQSGACGAKPRPSFRDLSCCGDKACVVHPTGVGYVDANFRISRPRPNLRLRNSFRHARENTMATVTRTAQRVANEVESESQASDARLVEEARGGSQTAFAKLVQRYERRLLRVVGRFIRDQDQAEDLAQETFLRVYERLDQFDPSRRFGPWLFRIGVTCAWTIIAGRSGESGAGCSVTAEPRTGRIPRWQIRGRLRIPPRKSSRWWHRFRRSTGSCWCFETWKTSALRKSQRS